VETYIGISIMINLVFSKDKHGKHLSIEAVSKFFSKLFTTMKSMGKTERSQQKC